MIFNSWLDSFLSEQGIDLGQPITVITPGGTPNRMTVETVVDAIKAAPTKEQYAIKATLVKVDFINANPVPYFEHLAQALTA